MQRHLIMLLSHASVSRFASRRGCDGRVVGVAGAVVAGFLAGAAIRDFVHRRTQSAGERVPGVECGRWVCGRRGCRGRCRGFRWSWRSALSDALRFQVRDAGAPSSFFQNARASSRDLPFHPARPAGNGLPGSQVAVPRFGDGPTSEGGGFWLQAVSSPEWRMRCLPETGRAGSVGGPTRCISANQP